MSADRKLLAAGSKHPGHPWQMATRPGAGVFDPASFSFTLSCPNRLCWAPLHVDAALVRGAMIVVIDACRRCGDSAVTERTQAAAVAEAWRIVRVRAAREDR